MPPAREEILIGASYRPGQQAIAHRATVDEQILVLGRVSVEGRQARMPDEGHAVTLSVDGQRIVGEVATHHVREPAQERILRPAQILGGGAGEALTLTVPD